MSNSIQPTNISEPQISVAVNGKDLQNGTRITTGKNPRLEVGIQSADPIESVLIRIDGQTWRAYSPNITNFSTSTLLDISDGGHSVTVIATGISTTLHSITIVEDAIAPRISFEEPFATTAIQPPNQNYTLNTTNITLRGQLTDRSAVERVVIKHRYEYRFSGKQTERSRYTIDNPNGSFAQQLTLGPNRKNQTNGTNYITVSTNDIRNNHREHSFILNISDTEPPALEILKVTPLHAKSAVELTIRVEDNVGISTIGRRLGSGNNTGLRSYYSETNIYNQPTGYTTTATFSASATRDRITLFAADIVDNNATLNYSMAYEEFVAPKIAINTERTQMVEEGSVKAVGTISRGRFSHVEIEARASDGTLSDIVVLQADEIDNYMQFNKTIQVGSYPASIRVRARDVTGRKHIEKYQINRPELQQTPQPAPNIPTQTPTIQAQPTIIETEGSTTALTVTSQQTTTKKTSTETATTTQRLSLLEQAIGYTVSVLAYTLASTVCTIFLYIIARKSLAGRV